MKKTCANFLLIEHYNDYTLNINQHFSNLGESVTEYLANIGELEQFYANIEEKCFVSLAQLIDYVRHYAASIVTANEEKNQRSANS